MTATATSAEQAPALPTWLLAQLQAQAESGKGTCLDLVTPQGDLLALDLTPRRGGQLENDATARVAKARIAVDRAAAAFAADAATSDGLDVVTALDRAVRHHTVPGTLVVVTSGISTVDPVDLGVLGWDVDADQVAAKLKEQGQLPELAGWTVRIAGIGAAAGEQPVPGIGLRRRLGELVLALCRAAGAKACVVDDELLPQARTSSTNRVPVVPLPRAETVPADPARGEPARVSLPGAYFEIDRARIEPYADAALKALAAQLATSDVPVCVVGRTDAETGSPAHNVELSRSRARSVADRLTRLGVGAGRLRVSGVGSAGTDPQKEADDPRQVSRDRRVDVTFPCATESTP